MLLCSASVLSSWEGEGGKDGWGGGDVSVFSVAFFPSHWFHHRYKPQFLWLLYLWFHESSFVACCPRTNTPTVLSFSYIFSLKTSLYRGKSIQCFILHHVSHHVISKEARSFAQTHSRERILDVQGD